MLHEGSPATVLQAAFDGTALRQRWEGVVLGVAVSIRDRRGMIELLLDMRLIDTDCQQGEADHLDDVKDAVVIEMVPADTESEMRL